MKYYAKIPNTNSSGHSINACKWTKGRALCDALGITMTMTITVNDSDILMTMTTFIRTKI